MPPYICIHFETAAEEEVKSELEIAAARESHREKQKDNENSEWKLPFAHARIALKILFFCANLINGIIMLPRAALSLSTMKAHFVRHNSNFHRKKNRVGSLITLVILGQHEFSPTPSSASLCRVSFFLFNFSSSLFFFVLHVRQAERERLGYSRS